MARVKELFGSKENLTMAGASGNGSGSLPAQPVCVDAKGMLAVPGGAGKRPPPIEDSSLSVNQSCLHCLLR
jgi:hypothetical protein